MRYALALCAVLAFGSPSFADIITINPADYPNGVPDFPGLVMSRLTQHSTYPAPALYEPTVRAIEFSTTNGWENYDGCYRFGQVAPTRACMDGFNLIELAFDTPTDFVHLDSIYGSDAPRIWAYDVAGNMIGNIGPSTWTQIPTGWTSTLDVVHDQRDIARIVVGGALGNARITEVSYKVSEPATFGIMAIGLLGFVLVRKR